MRYFVDEKGSAWVASVAQEEGGDYKGRFYLTMQADVSESEGGGGSVALEDVRWNSRQTAERTLATMSEVELRRRLRTALGRAGPGRLASWNV